MRILCRIFSSSNFCLFHNSCLPSESKRKTVHQELCNREQKKKLYAKTRRQKTSMKTLRNAIFPAFFRYREMLGSSLHVRGCIVRRVLGAVTVNLSMKHSITLSIQINCARIFSINYEHWICVSAIPSSVQWGSWQLSLCNSS